MLEVRSARGLPEVVDEGTDEVQLRLSLRRAHLLEIGIHELQPPPRRREVRVALVDAQDEPTGNRGRACSRRGESADVHPLRTTRDLFDQGEEAEKACGAHVTAVVDHEHFGKARAGRVATDAVAELEGKR